MTSSNKPNQYTQAPMFVLMLHPTSGRQGFNGVSNQTALPRQTYIDPKYSTNINMQTQHAIATSGMPTGIPHQRATMPRGSSHSPHTYYPTRR
jgi:hypothetical protein